MSIETVICRAKTFAERLGIRRESDWRKVPVERWEVYSKFKSQVAQVAGSVEEYDEGIKGIVDALQI